MNNSDRNYQEDIINTIYILKLTDNLQLQSFKNMLRETILHMESQVDYIQDNIQNFKLKLSLYIHLEKWVNSAIEVRNG